MAANISVQNLISTLRLLRLGNATLAGASVLIGALLLPGPITTPLWLAALWGAFSMMALAAGGNAENDAVDIEIDKRNRPGRVLARGALTPKQALSIAYGCYGAGIFFAFKVSFRHAFLALGMALLLQAYNRKLKRMPFLGNLAVAALCAAALWFIEWPSWPIYTLPAVGFAFATTWLREILKDLEDMPGDAAAGHRTLPLRYGPLVARKWAFALALIITASLPVPCVLLGWPYSFLVVSVLGAVPFLLHIAWRIRPDAEQPDFSRLQKEAKAVMLAGLVAIVVANLKR